LALFGYDPLKYKLGRGILSALGIDFDLRQGDVAARINFATVDGKGNVVDRRAGRISSDTNRRLCERIRRGVELGFEGEFFLQTVSEHRAVLVLRGRDLGAHVRDTDPQSTGVKPPEPDALDDGSRNTAQIVRSFVNQTKKILGNEESANMILLRGFDGYEPFPSLESRFGLNGICIAEYPIYRGLSRLLGMEVASPPEGIDASFEMLSSLYGDDYDFYFLHIKKTDSTGENGDFGQKVEAIEMVDRLIPAVIDLHPDVLVVTADHSTPARMAVHSWHPVPLIISSRLARVDPAAAFDEYTCLQGALGVRPGMHLMGLALAHAGRLTKYGA
jgi:2,3-bisphosphoglycerate-independent phosphoglycerate mutase